MTKRSDFWGFTIWRVEVCFYKRQLLSIVYVKPRTWAHPTGQDCYIWHTEAQY
jgi:hypothetical protein